MKNCEHSIFYSRNCRRPWVLKTLLFSTFSTVNINCHAASESAFSGIRFHGFASQSLITTSDNNFFGDTDDALSLEYTELGINLSTRPTSSILLAFQVLARRAGEGHENDLELDYGLLDYRLVTNEAGDLGVRLGRIKNPFGLYNDTRDVAFTRPSAILPQSIYFDRVRDVALSADGAELYGEKRMKWGFISVQLGAGHLRLNNRETEQVLLGNDRPGKMDDKLSFIGRIMFNSDNENIRIALSTSKVNIDYLPGETDPSGPGDIEFLPIVFSFQYAIENLIFTSEYALRHFKYNDIIYSPLEDFTGESYYLQLHHQLQRRLWGYLRYDVTYLNKDDKDGKNFEKLTFGARPDYSQFAKDWTIGARWDINHDWMLTAEHHWIDGTAWLPVLDNPDPLQATRRWRMFMMTVSARF